jgi:Cytochrome c oxidase subunit IV
MHQEEHPTAEELHIHMPSASFSPIILALGLTVAGFGIAFGTGVIIVGAIITVIGLGTWIYDDIKNASAEQHH